LLEESPCPPAKARVTPQELNGALSAIEARRAAAVSQMENTLSIEEAVTHLGLDITPEELLAEVEAQRKKAATVAVTPTRQTVRKGRRRLFVTVLGLSLLLNIALSLYTFRTATLTPYQRVIAAMPEKKPIYASIETIRALATGQISGQFVLEGLQKPHFALWTVEKVNGELFVRGWRERSDSGDGYIVGSSAPSPTAEPLQRFPIADFTNVGAPFSNRYDGLRESVFIKKR
jgi:hypothetical protein